MNRLLAITASALLLISCGGGDDSSDSPTPPVAFSASYTLEEDSSISESLSGQNLSASATFKITSAPTNGTLDTSGASFTYTPNANFFGTDSFSFTTSDNGLTSAEALITLTIDPVDDDPIAQNVVASTQEDQWVIVEFLVSDPDLHDVTVSLQNPEDEKLFKFTGFTTQYADYHPPADFFGEVTYNYVATDVTGRTSVASVTINIEPVNDAPMLSFSESQPTFSTASTAVFNVTASDIDSELSELNVNISSLPTGIQITRNWSAMEQSFELSIADKVDNTGPFEVTVSDGELSRSYEINYSVLHDLSLNNLTTENTTNVLARAVVGNDNVTYIYQNRFVSSSSQTWLQVINHELESDQVFSIPSQGSFYAGFTKEGSNDANMLFERTASVFNFATFGEDYSVSGVDVTIPFSGPQTGGNLLVGALDDQQYLFIGRDKKAYQYNADGTLISSAALPDIGLVYRPTKLLDLQLTDTGYRFLVQNNECVAGTTCTIGDSNPKNATVFEYNSSTNLFSYFNINLNDSDDYTSGVLHDNRAYLTTGAYVHAAELDSNTASTVWSMDIHGSVVPEEAEVVVNNGRLFAILIGDDGRTPFMYLGFDGLIQDAGEFVIRLDNPSANSYHFRTYELAVKQNDLGDLFIWWQSKRNESFYSAPSTLIVMNYLGRYQFHHQVEEFTFYNYRHMVSRYDPEHYFFQVRNNYDVLLSAIKGQRFDYGEDLIVQQLTTKPTN